MNHHPTPLSRAEYRRSVASEIVAGAIFLALLTACAACSLIGLAWQW